MFDWSLHCCLVRVVYLLTLFVGSDTAFAQMAVVGDLATRDRIVTVGGQDLDPRAIAFALDTNWRIITAGDAQAPLKPYLAALHDEVLCGLQYKGFPDASVSVTVDPDRGPLRISVSEGVRFRKGAIVIRGCSNALANYLRNWLLARQVPAEAHRVTASSSAAGATSSWVLPNGEEAEYSPPLWSRRGPAPFDQRTDASLCRHIANGLARKGYFDCKFSLDVIPDRSTTTAELRVTISEIGEQSRISKIEVNGNEYNSREDILTLLQLNTGQVYTAAVSDRCYEVLCQSARFLKYAVDARRDPEGSGVILTVSVREFSKAPPLSQPLSREEQGLVRCRDWLQKTMKEGAEIVVRGKDAAPSGALLQELVVSRDEGVLMTVGPSGQTQLALHAGASQVGAYWSDGNAHLAARWPGLGCVRLSAKLDVLDKDEDHKEQKLTLGMAFFVPTDSSRAVPLEARIRMDPVFFLAQVHAADTVCTWDGDLLTMQSPTTTWHIDTRDGRLVNGYLRNKDRDCWEFSLEQSYLNRRLAELQQRAGANQFDSHRTWASVLDFFTSPIMREFLITCAASASAESQARWKTTLRLHDVVAQLAKKGALPVFASAGGVLNRRPDYPSLRANFSIPEPSSETASRKEREARDYCVAGLTLLDLIVERETWPNQLGRAVAFSRIGESARADRQLEVWQHASSQGPLGHLIAAHLHSAPCQRLQFAQQGLARLSAEDFRSEVDVLVRTAREFGWDRATVVLLRALSADDDRLLGADIAGQPSALKAVARNLQSYPSDDAALAALPRILDDIWEESWRSSIEGLLRARAERDVSMCQRTLRASNAGSAQTLFPSPIDRLDAFITKPPPNAPSGSARRK